MKPLHITLELMSHQSDRESTHHRTWWKEFVKGHEDSEGHFYIATTHKPKDNRKRGWRYLPVALHPALMPGYIQQLKELPRMARGNVGWIEEPSPHTFGIVSSNDRLPFRDSTVTRIVRYNTIAPRSYNAEGQQDEETLLDDLREAYRVLKPGTKIEFHETRAEEMDASVSFNRIVELVKRFNDELRAKLVEAKIAEAAAKHKPAAVEADEAKIGFDTKKIKVRRYSERITQTDKKGRSLTTTVEKHALMIPKLH